MPFNYFRVTNALMLRKYSFTCRTHTSEPMEYQHNYSFLHRLDDVKLTVFPIRTIIFTYTIFNYFCRTTTTAFYKSDRTRRFSRNAVRNERNNKQLNIRRRILFACAVFLYSIATCRLLKITRNVSITSHVTQIDIIHFFLK